MQTALLQLWLRRNRLTRSRFCKSRTGTAEALRLRLHFRPKAEVRRGGGKGDAAIEHEGIVVRRRSVLLEQEVQLFGGATSRSESGRGRKSIGDTVGKAVVTPNSSPSTASTTRAGADASPSPTKAKQSPSPRAPPFSPASPPNVKQHGTVRKASSVLLTQFLNTREADSLSEDDETIEF